MRNFKLVLEYDGTDFHGWQIQPDRRTVQGELCRAIEETTLVRSMATGAGRTDAGVHAVGQVASFASETLLGPAVLKRAFNARLPKDVRVRSVDEAPPRFNARFDAKSRTYHYVFIGRPTALWRNYYYLVTVSLDLAAMRRALAELIGEKDFTAFASSRDDSTTKRCRVIKAELIETPPLVTLAVTADHFLHHMVRSIAGTVLEIGKGKPKDMAGIIAGRDPAPAGPTLPPHALYLMQVGY
ncbi:MAG: tRNA pseudouridine(38-40) synthase TruA [Candidatus Krumholzibacteria bacterium]|nr:tRNA pseudouridine(38-40) synthase TruA [Candidatus Krumholzibacteria bacterium]